MPGPAETASPVETIATGEIPFLQSHQLEQNRRGLLAHPLYEAVNTAARLRVFMRNHVFAVWDFMSLLKRLQRDVAGCSLPWQPPRDAKLARFLNEIVLAEECDTDGAEGWASHFELYLDAMQQLQADTADVTRFLDRLSTGSSLHEAFAGLNIADETIEFVTANLTLAEQGGTHEVAAAFCIGREDLIPDMFELLSKSLAGQGTQVDRLRYYLDRHIELDGDSHGPLARQLVRSLCGDDPARQAEATAAAENAVQLRIRLWDGILEQLERGD